jgi:hypothetical protein
VDSEIRYDELKPVEVRIPAGLELHVQLAAGIDLTKARVGDLVSARVAAPAARRGVVVPEGAVLNGRIRRLGRGLVALEFTELQFGNRRAQFFARLESLDPSAGVLRIPGNSPRLPGVVTFGVPEGDSKLPSGLGMLWQTQSPPR